jgi:hypothetical protein
MDERGLVARKVGFCFRTVKDFAAVSGKKVFHFPESEIQKNISEKPKFRLTWFFRVEIDSHQMFYRLHLTARDFF